MAARRRPRVRPARLLGGTAAATAVLAGVLAAAGLLTPAGVARVLPRTTPLAVERAWAGPDGRFAFVQLARRAGLPGPAFLRGGERALVVDLAAGTWRPAAEGRSLFVDPAARSGVASWLGEPPPVLEVLGEGSARRTLDTRTARAVAARPPDAADDARVAAAFGLDAPPRLAHVRWAGLGHVLAVPRERGLGFAERVRDPATGRVAGEEALRPGAERRPLDVRVLRGLWLVRDGERWLAHDPATGATAPCPHLAPGDEVGPALSDGRVLVVSAGEVLLLDGASGARAPVRVDGADGTVRTLAHGRLGTLAPSPALSVPVPADAPTVLLVTTDAGPRLGLLDPAAGTLALAAGSAAELRVLHQAGPVAIVQEDDARLVRVDLAAGTRTVAFDARDVR